MMANGETNPDPSKEDSMEELADAGEIEEFTEEYDHLNTTIDQLDSCLDAIEQRNDDLYSQLQELLEASRQTRQDMQAEREQAERGGGDDEGGDGAAGSGRKEEGMEEESATTEGPSCSTSKHS